MPPMTTGPSTNTHLTRAAQSVTPPSGWAATNTVGLQLLGATPQGTLSPATQLNIVVALALNDPAGAQTLAQRVNNPSDALYGQFVSPSQFAASYGPTSAQVNAVTAYLTKQGFSSVQAEPNNLFVSATGTAAQVQAAFNTSLQQFAWNGLRVYTNPGPAYVPTSLSGIVLSVLGLNNIPAQTAIHKASGLPCDVSVQNNCVRSYNAAGFQQAYDAGATPTGRSTTIAVMAEGNISQVTSDLRYYEQQNGLPQVPVTVVQVGIPTPDTSSVDEWDLDSQTSTGIAGNVSHLYFYVTSSLTDSDLALDFNRWASQDVAKIGNASLGICEFFAYLDGSMLADDQVFLEAAAQGQTMFAATGDQGSACGVGAPNGVPAAGPPFVEYPSASAYVVAVGGTTLVTDTSGNYGGEAAWYAGGGGISQFEPSPYWQSTVVTVGPQCNCKATPDIAMVADPNTGAEIFIAGTASYYGGTSLASPLAMGMYARMQTAHANKLGFASPRLYSLYGAADVGPAGTPPTDAKGPYHDVITGTNGLFAALPGYDNTTGLGTIDIAKLAAAI
ncbi:MAG: S53 family peptidase [Vulcanimicrobiaceae bacterium]